MKNKNNFIKLFRSQNVTIFVKSLQIKLQIDSLFIKKTKKCIHNQQLSQVAWLIYQ